jgi:hypothetical protein
MVKSLRHRFQSAIADGGDATIVRPSNWNDDHDLWLGYRTVSLTSDTIAHADHMSLVTYNNGSPIAITLPAPAGGNMPSGWRTTLRNTGAGIATVTGGGGATINVSGIANASYALNQGDTIDIYSQGTTAYFGVVTKAPNQVLQPNFTNTITVGYTFTPNSLGNIAASFTPNPALGNYQFGTNNGAFTFNVPASDCAMDILITNSATAGAITFTGFTVGANVGDALTTVSGSRFIISVRRINAISTYIVKALQ